MASITNLDRLRAAFAAGVISLDSSAALHAARDDGNDWEAVTEAVAAGLAERYGTTELATDDSMLRSPVRSPTLVTLAGATVLYVILRPVFGFGHELVVAGLAQLLRIFVASGVWEPLLGIVRLDPIYAGAAIRAAGGVQVAGIAVAGPVGQFLSDLAPGMFLHPQQVADGAGVSMVALAGAPAIGRGLAAFGADVLWLAVGVWLCWHWRRLSWPLALIGIFIQAQIVVNHLFDGQVSVADLDASGLPFALALALPQAGWMTDGLNAMNAAWRTGVVGAAMLVLGYACALALVATLSAVSRVLRRAAAGVGGPATAEQVRYSIAAMSVGVALAAAWSPVGALAKGHSNWQLSPAARSAMRSLTSPVTAQPVDVWLAGPTNVEVRQTPGGWQYVVDQTPTAIRGVGYNPQYSGLPETDRTRLYTRDFSAMRSLGINTIEGWFEGQFDQVTLDTAAYSGIGVIMPFEINQDWPIDDPNVQQSILDHVSDYVERYKNYPAVRMWAPGNENLHRILYAHWLSQANDPTARARADAFAAFLPRLVDRIHELDPRHPVVYRDAEDVYLDRVANAFNQVGGNRPWLIYGANVYSTPRLQQIIAQWPGKWPGHALLISEFAPGGVGPAERPSGFQQQWTLIRTRPDEVLGGLAYTWATNGPEDLDRVFGLVDASGVPTDGALAALADTYLNEAAATVRSSQ